MINKSTRRDFMKNSALVGTAWWVGHSFASGADSKNPLERLNFASIGVGGKGSGDCSHAGYVGNIVGLCDIDDLQLEKKGHAYKSARRFNDYREMLDVMANKIDAVTVSTPDHSHASAAILAMRKGKHVYSQKPLTWSVYEARRMREVANEMKVATQMGNQGTANPGFRTAVEIVRSGAIGPVKEVHVWTNRPIWPQGEGRPNRTDPVPPNVHWDLFLGPAPERPFVAGVYHPFKWRGWLDFGTGALGDMACHTANMAVMSLELFDPIAVDVKLTSGIVENESYPKYSVLEYYFPERTTVMFDKPTKLPACKMTWYDGQQYPPKELLQGEKRSDSGLLLVGEHGSLYSPNDYGARHVLLPRDKFKDYKHPEPFLPRTHGVGDDDARHLQEWAAACRGGKPAMSNYNYSSRLTETMLLGNLALRAGGRIEWDAKEQKVTNLPAANKFVRREYRSGYSIRRLTSLFTDDVSSPRTPGPWAFLSGCVLKGLAVPGTPKIAFSTLACPTWGWEEIVAAGIRHGYDGVEIRQVAGETDLLKVPAFEPAQRVASHELLRRRSGSIGSRSFSVCGLASSVRFDFPQTLDREAQLRIGKSYVELAAQLEARFVRVFGDVVPAPTKAPERKESLAQIAEGLNRLGDFAAAYKIDILLETHGDFAESATVQELFEQIESPRVGVLWDTHHPWRFYNESPEATFAMLRPWVRHTHWKDSVTLPDEPAAGHDAENPAEQGAYALMSGHRHADYVLFGGGEFPIQEFIHLLKEAGYDGWLSLEWEKMWHPNLADPDVALPLFARKMRHFWQNDAVAR